LEKFVRADKEFASRAEMSLLRSFYLVTGNL
jgi:hypothetical protein